VNTTLCLGLAGCRTSRQHQAPVIIIVPLPLWRALLTVCGRGSLGHLALPSTDAGRTLVVFCPRPGSTKRYSQRETRTM